MKSISAMSFALLFVVTAVTGVRADERKHAPETTAEVKQLIAEEKAVLLDVREPKEWQKGHVKDAFHMPLSLLGKNAKDPAALAKLLAELPKDKPIFVHCASGHRCLLACETLDKLSDYDFRPLKPGYKDLIAAGFTNADGD